MKEIRIDNSDMAVYVELGKAGIPDFLGYQDSVYVAENSVGNTSYLGNNNVVAHVLYDHDYDVLAYFQPYDGPDKPNPYTYWIFITPDGRREIMATISVTGKYNTSIRVRDIEDGIPYDCPASMLQFVDEFNERNDPEGLKRRWMRMCILNQIRLIHMMVQNR